MRLRRCALTPSSPPPLPRYASITRSFFWISLRRALGDLLAVVEHGDAVGDAHDDAHVVLDQQHRQPALVAQPADERR